MIFPINHKKALALQSNLHSLHEAITSVYCQAFYRSADHHPAHQLIRTPDAVFVGLPR